MSVRLTLTGVGAMRSPRYRPAGLLVAAGRSRVMIDGGDRAPRGRLDAWLVTDERAELMPALRRLARRKGLTPRAGPFTGRTVTITPRRVSHTSHPAYGYLIRAGRGRVVWAPEFWRFPRWAAGADLVFADAAGWARPIAFAGGVGGHACVLDVARAAGRLRVGRLVFAHIGRPTIRAVDAGDRPPFGELGRDGQVLVVR